MNPNLTVSLWSTAVLVPLLLALLVLGRHPWMSGLALLAVLVMWVRYWLRR